MPPGIKRRKKIVMNKVIKRILIVALAVWAVLVTFLFVVALSVCYDLSDKNVATEKEMASLQKEYEFLSAEHESCPSSYSAWSYQLLFEELFCTVMGYEYDADAEFDRFAEENGLTDLDKHYLERTMEFDRARYVLFGEERWGS